MAPARRASRNASQHVRDVLAIFLLLLVRGNCFHSSQFPHRSCFSRASSRSSLFQTQEGAEGGSVPVLLRDVVIEKIEELGGGKVQQVRVCSVACVLVHIGKRTLASSACLDTGFLSSLAGASCKYLEH